MLVDPDKLFEVRPFGGIKDDQNDKSAIPTRPVAIAASATILTGRASRTLLSANRVQRGFSLITIFQNYHRLHGRLDPMNYRLGPRRKASTVPSLTTALSSRKKTHPSTV
jgi:hypothetical protein